MPTYVYDILDAQGRPTGERFEEFQSMKDDALTAQPGTGRPCRRAIVAPAIGNKDLHGKAQILTEMQCQPHEVGTVRKLFGDLGHCWQDDGSVKVKNKGEARKMFQREQQIMGRFAEQKAEGKLPTKAEKKAKREGQKARVPS